MGRPTAMAADDATAAQKALAQRLGHRFADPSLLTAALTHASFVNEHTDAGPSYQRLEFLGDAALGLLAAHMLFAADAVAREGVLSQRRARLVQRDALAELARQLSLGDSIRLGAARPANGPGANVLADVLEAVAGAIFVDGGFAAMVRCFEPLLRQTLAEDSVARDYKTRLQEVVHPLGLPAPTYLVERCLGPAHAQHVACCVRLGSAVYGRASGPSKKAAEQLCAQQALSALGHELRPPQA